MDNAGAMLVQYLIRTIYSCLDSAFLNQLYDQLFRLCDTEPKCKSHFLKSDGSEWLKIEDQCALLDLVHEGWHMPR